MSLIATTARLLNTSANIHKAPAGSRVYGKRISSAVTVVVANSCRVFSLRAGGHTWGHRLSPPARLLFPPVSRFFWR